MQVFAYITTGVGYVLGPLVLLLAGLLIFIQSLVSSNNFLEGPAKMLCRLIPATFGIRVKVRGLENVDRRKAVIFMSNHVNIFDPIILYGHIPNFTRALELDEHFRWPVWGFIIKRLGNIPISHTNVAGALESLEKARTAVAEGTSIGIMPEGHRTRDGKMGPFKRGAFRFARQAGTDIVPIALKGLWERKTVHSPLVIPGTVEVIFGVPVSAGEAAKMSERELRDRMREILTGMLGENKDV